MQRYKSEDLINLAVSAMWPAVVLVALVLFYFPVSRILIALADRSDDIQTIKVGTLELNIRQRDITQPTPAVSGTLQKMNGDDIARLFVHQTGNGACYQNGQLDDNYKKDVRLVEQGVLVMTPRSTSSSWCPNDHQMVVTDVGENTKKFIVTLLSEIVVKKATSK